MISQHTTKSYSILTKKKKEKKRKETEINFLKRTRNRYFDPDRVNEITTKQGFPTNFFQLHFHENFRLMKIRHKFITRKLVFPIVSLHFHEIFKQESITIFDSSPLLIRKYCTKVLNCCRDNLSDQFYSGIRM